MNSQRKLLVLAVLLTGMMIIGPASAAGQTETRIIHFAGRDWHVKSGINLGPGPNNWSDDPQSVWVDESGKLHLRIRNINGVWHSAEVYSVEPAGYGLHRFYVDTPIHDLDINVVLGLFLYQDDLNEVDVEVARWGQVGAPNAQFVVQPYDLPGHRESYFVNWNGPTTYEFNWQPDAVQFRGIQGHDPNSGPVIHQWSFAQDGVPQENPEMRIRMNLWLLNPPAAPADGQEVEVVIANLEAPQGMTQDVDCGEIDLSEVYVALAQAQTALDNGDQAVALAAISQARITLQNIENQCDGGMLTSPTPVTDTPAPSGEPITMVENNGQVSGAVSAEFCNADYKIALFAQTDIWYVQPYDDGRRNIQIGADCIWQAVTCSWNQLAAHVVRADYDIPTASWARSCPPLSGEGVFAEVCLER